MAMPCPACGRPAQAARTPDRVIHLYAPDAQACPRDDTHPDAAHAARQSDPFRTLRR